MKKVAEILREKRLQDDLTLKDVSLKTKIPLEHLESIEMALWCQFSSHTYLQGIIRKYSSFLKLDQQKTLSYLKRELETKETHFIRSLDYQEKSHRFSINWFIYAVMLLVITFFFVQILISWQKPLLKIEAIPSKIKQNTPLVIKGRTIPGVLLYLNGEQIYQDENGQFLEKLYLKKKGGRDIEIKAIGVNGKEQTKVFIVTVQ